MKTLRCDVVENGELKRHLVVSVYPQCEAEGALHLHVPLPAFRTRAGEAGRQPLPCVWLAKCPPIQTNKPGELSHPFPPGSELISFNDNKQLIYMNKLLGPWQQAE